MTQPSVILATASYDHTIKFWEAKSGRCYRTIQYPDSVSIDLILICMLLICLGLCSRHFLVLFDYYAVSNRCKCCGIGL